MKKVLLALSFLSGCGQLAHAGMINGHEVWRSTTIAASNASVFISSRTILLGRMTVNRASTVVGSSVNFYNAIEAVSGGKQNSVRFSLDVTTAGITYPLGVTFTSATALGMTNSAEVTLFWDVLYSSMPTGHERDGLQ